MDEATQDLRRTLQRLDSQIDPTATQLGETLTEAKQALATFNSTALTLRRFIGAQQNVYEGMIVGQNSRPDDLVVNVCKQKHVTNMRNASASEDAMRLISVHPMTLEECLEFIDDDELLEITPKNLRMRKRILNAGDRARQWRYKQD